MMHGAEMCGSEEACGTCRSSKLLSKTEWRVLGAIEEAGSGGSAGSGQPGWKSRWMNGLNPVFMDIPYWQKLG